MIYCTWNVRGLNNPQKIKEVRKFVEKCGASFVGLVETKVKNSKIHLVQQKLNRDWQWFTNNNDQEIGRIWIGWNPSDLQVSILDSSDQMVHCEAHIPHGEVVLVTVVYGRNSNTERQALWEQLLACKCSVPWLISGDFNAALFHDDRLNGCTLNELRDFENFVDQAEVVEVQSKGSHYSWSNKGEGNRRNASRIDRGLVNKEWMDTFNATEVVYHPPGLSDHCPLVFTVDKEENEGGRPFRFLNALASHDQFKEAVVMGWGEAQGNATMNQVWMKLKNVKKELKKLNSKEFAQVAEKVEDARHRLYEAQVQLQDDIANIELQQAEREHTHQLKYWSAVEESIMKQKSRIDWLKLGDANTKFFHASMKQRQQRNRMKTIFKADNTLCKEPKEIRAEVENFYKGLLGTKASVLPHVDLHAVRNGPTLETEDQTNLIQEVTRGEVDAAIKSIHGDKAPGIDGFNSCFFKAAWDVIKEDIYNAVLGFFTTGKLMRSWNCTSITLVPKVQNPSYVKEYRPIACCSVLYKIISKILTNRLAGVVGKVVGENQSGFIPGRQIVDNIILATELIKNYTHKYISPRCTIKVDLKKAYDSLEWSFLEDMMVGLGFPLRFVGWVMECVTTVSYSILINGVPGKPFAAKKGLRQGDPMSPFLFAIGMEYLTRCLKQMQDTGDFNYHPKCEKLGVSHLMFADDLLLFARADVPSVQILYQTFQKFSQASGLEANLDKTEMYMGGVSDSDKQQILHVLPVSLGSLPFKYLGIPLSSKKLTYVQCKPLLEKIIARMKCWSVKFLSYSGRLQLIKSVIFGMQTYWSQIFILPKKLIKEIEKMSRVFLWTGNVHPSRRALVAWESVCLPKTAGGWNVVSLLVWNKVAVMKLLWALANKADKLWVKWVHTYYVKKKSIWDAKLPQKASWVLKKIFDSRQNVDSANGWKNMMRKGVYSIKQAYELWRPQGNKVRWNRLICNNPASPRSIFILWLALHNRLSTKDNISKWNSNISRTCPVCDQGDECLQHLFFECPTADQLWRKVLGAMQQQRAPKTWQEEVQDAMHAARKRSKKYRLYVMLFTETVCALWLHRNACVFDGVKKDVIGMFSDVMFRVYCRCHIDSKNSLPNLAIVAR